MWTIRDIWLTYLLAVCCCSIVPWGGDCSEKVCGQPHVCAQVAAARSAQALAGW